MAEQLFDLGEVVSTPGAIDALDEAGIVFLWPLLRHASGDWGDICEEDKRENGYALQHGLRLLSAYTLPTGVKIWIITEADRSVTTLLLPEEY